MDTPQETENKETQESKKQDKSADQPICQPCHQHAGQIEAKAMDL